MDRASEHYLSHTFGELHYLKSGKENNVLLAFHGFGQNKEQFLKSLTPWELTHTIYIFDLPFHGSSTWNTSNPISKEEWKSVINKFLKENDISTFSLLGFSMGGKLVLSILESFPNSIDSIFFVAPDGFKLSPWYKLATSTLLFRRVFKFVCFYPSILFSFTTILEHLKVMNPGLIKFVKSELRSKSQSIRVYNSWVGLRLLNFEIKEILDLINKNNISAYLFLGTRDNVIKVNFFEEFINGLNTKNVHQLNCGHALVMNLAAKTWYEQFKQQSPKSS